MLSCSLALPYHHQPDPASSSDYLVNMTGNYNCAEAGSRARDTLMDRSVLSWPFLDNVLGPLQEKGCGCVKSNNFFYGNS